jgi:chromosome segregation ATPase
MLNLEQVRALEARVEKAVVLITKLRQENADQERRLADAAKSEELLKSQLAAQARAATESTSRLEGLGARAKEAEEKAAQAELKAAEAEERAAATERKAQAADEEIAHYRDRALTAERRVADLESKAEELKSEQERIEQGLMQALSKLDSFEDMVLEMSLGSNSESAESLAPEQEAAPLVSEEAPFDQRTFERAEHDTSESDQGGGSAQEPDEASQPDLESQDAPFRGGENELDIF